jgi:PAS domain-containing protein
VFETRTKQTYEIQLERADGVQFPARFDSVAVKDAEGYFTRWRIIVDDVTDLKRAEDSLRESEELHRITLSSISDTVLITDDSDVFTYVCPNVNVIFGYSKEEVASSKRSTGCSGMIYSIAPNSIAGKRSLTSSATSWTRPVSSTCC